MGEEQFLKRLLYTNMKKKQFILVAHYWTLHKNNSSLLAEIVILKLYAVL